MINAKTPHTPEEHNKIIYIPNNEMCPDCKNPNGEFIEDFASGDLICHNCGLVVGDRIVDVRSEWRNFADSTDDRSRASRIDEHSGLSTDISKPIGGPGGGNNLGQYHQRMQTDQSNQNLSAGFDKIGNIADVMHLTQKVKNKAKELYSEFESKRQKTMRCKRDSVVAAIIYMACKEGNVSRTFKEISRDTQIAEKEIRKYYRALGKTLGPRDGGGRTSPADLVVCVPPIIMGLGYHGCLMLRRDIQQNRYCSKLKLPQPIANLAIEIADKATPCLEGKSPASIAAAAILMATKLRPEGKRLEKDIAAAASISATTIRTAFKDMLPHQDIILPKGETPLTNSN